MAGDPISVSSEELVSFSLSRVAQLGADLDETASQLVGEREDTQAGMTRLLKRLDATRAHFPRREWTSFCREVFVGHRVHQMLKQDPFTERSYTKPRGYPGDAEMLDYIYRYRTASGVTKLGQDIAAVLVESELAQAIRHRLRVVAAAIDEVSRDLTAPRVLALGAGHLREGRISEAIAGRRLGELIAVDHDPESLAEVATEFGEYGVRTYEGSVLDLSFQHLGEFDLIYASGLFDYLWRGAAREVISAALPMLRPGGKLLVANLTPRLLGAGYLEAVTDWWLIYRTPDDMASLVDHLDPAIVAGHRVFVGRHESIAFLEIVRA